MRFRNLFVAVEFEPASLHAVETACRLADPHESQLTLFHCVDVRGYAYATEIILDEVLRGLHAEAATRLDAVARRVSEAGLRVNTIVAEGAAHVEAVRAARDVGADLILLGTHGRRGISRVLLGSVAERIVRLADAPVLTTHAWYFDTREEAGGAIAREADLVGAAFDRVVATSAGAVPIATAAARALRAAPGVFVVEPLGTEGTDDVPCGVVSESGAMIDMPTAIQNGIARPDRAAARAVERAQREGERLRGMRPRADVAGQAVLAVFESIERADLACFAVGALRAQGAGRVAIAAPLCTRRVAAELRREGVDLYCPVTTILGAPTLVFRHAGEPDVARAPAAPAAAL